MASEKDTVIAILEGIAVGSDALETSGVDTEVVAAASTVGILVRNVARILRGRSLAEAVKILEQIRDHGTKPIGEDTLDDQVEDILRGKS